MSFKLPATHKGRMPVCIWYKNNNIYFDLFLAIVGNDGLCCGTKAQCFKLENITSLREIGQLVINILEKFQRLGDLTLDELDKLPDYHNDPFDRLIICQAITENMTIITRDTIIPKYPVRTLW